MLGIILRSARASLLKGILIAALTAVCAAGGTGLAVAAGNDSSPVLSLDECIRLAVQGSPTVQIAGERQLIAEQGVKEAYGGFLPGL